ncbi:hypothetical protein REIFOR_01072 [Reinekea forsetii]|jgi:hypothetical protein|uniref:Uncharacterized protein n=3 Tax=Saccharospirillaceae TaxID=255527 RepID=A0A2K8KN33_9GAMM|nr:hypothetical protein REIFOR_01072 [Reinekea forsetii]
MVHVDQYSAFCPKEGWMPVALCRITPDNEARKKNKQGYMMAEKTPAGDLPRMVPDRDDIRTRNVRANPERKPAAEKKTSAGQSKSHTSWVVALFLIVAGVAIGYLALQQYSAVQLLNSYEERLILADERIVRLEQSLTQTDESVSMNGTAINAQFKAIKVETDMQMDEIRKLWDVANVRNRAWIVANQTALAEQLESVSLINTSLATVQSGQAEDVKKLASLSEQLSVEKTQRGESEQKFEQALVQIEQQFEQFTAVEQQLVQELGLITVDLAAASSTLGSIVDANYGEQILTLTLTQELAAAQRDQISAEQGKIIADQDEISAKQEINTANITELLGAIEAVDAGRLATNKRLTALSGQLDTVSAKVIALTGQ